MSSMEGQYFEKKRDEMQEASRRVYKQRSEKIRLTDSDFKELDRVLATICLSVAIAAVPLSAATDAKFAHPAYFFAGVGLFLGTGVWLIFNIKENAEEAVIKAVNENKDASWFYDELADIYNELIGEPANGELLLRLEGLKIQMAQELYKDSGVVTQRKGIARWVSKGYYVDWIFSAITLATLTLGASLWPYSIRDYTYVMLLGLILLFFRVNRSNRKIRRLEEQDILDEEEIRKRRRRKLDQWLKDKGSGEAGAKKHN